MIAFASVHAPVRYRGQSTGWHMLTLDDGMTFFSRDRPNIYNRNGEMIQNREILPGSIVRVAYKKVLDKYLMDAIQIENEPKDRSPFGPILD